MASKKKDDRNSSRRDFMFKSLPACALGCAGLSSLNATNPSVECDPDQDYADKIRTEFSISHEEFFKSRYHYYIKRMEKFAEYLGRDELISMLKKAVDELNLTGEPDLEIKSVKDFINPILKSKTWNIRLDFEVLELTDKVCQMKITNCIWAKTFREMNAGDIGYANTCHGDFTSATAYHPKLKLERTKTLMQGHDCCDHRYTWEG